MIVSPDSNLFKLLFFSISVLSSSFKSEKIGDFLSSPENFEDVEDYLEDEETPKIESIEGNVVKLSFKSGTKGNA